MTGRPAADEAAPYYFTYIDQVSGEDILPILDGQLSSTLSLLNSISEEKSLHRYASGKWSIRELWSHVNDAERAFAFRALWFARGFDSALPSFDQNIAAAGAKADDISWVSHVEEFRTIRLSTVAFFRHLPPEAWMRSGIASGNPFTVRALAYITAGHVVHHARILKERYL